MSAGYRFGDNDNKVFQRYKEDDYILEVVGFGFGTSNEGAPQVKLDVSAVNPKDLDALPHPTKVQCRLTLSEAAGWFADTFLKSCGVPDLKKGEDLEFNPKFRGRPGSRFIDLRGLRGWGRIIDKPGMKDKTKLYNEVGTWYTNRDKIPPRPYAPIDGSAGPTEMSAAEPGVVVPF
jgi:cold shock CspA family protein